MLPIKWKRFRMVTYLHMAITTLLGGYLLFRIFESLRSIRSAEDFLGFTVLVLCPSILLTNGSISLYLLEKYYPAQLPGTRLLRSSKIFGVFAWIVVLLYAVAAGLGIYELLIKYKLTFQQRPEGYMLLAGMLVICLSGFYLLWNQVSLRKAIRRNHEASLNSFLEDDQP
jgi:DMSO reductase anchor subunit